MSVKILWFFSWKIIQIKPIGNRERYLLPYLIMHPDKYTLTWYTHPDYLREMMREMMTSDDFTDVTLLVTDDKKTI